MRPSLILAPLLILAAPAMAEDTRPDAGRYAVQPSDDGFVRLDTKTGATSHCTRREGLWHCDTIAKDRDELEAKVAALAVEVAALSAELGRLRGELAETKAALDGATPPAARTPGDAEFERAMTFAERLMRRFFDMVRELRGVEERPSV